MRVLVARIEDLQQDHNRLENGRLDEQTCQDIQEHMAWLKERRSQTEARLSALLASNSQQMDEQEQPRDQDPLQGDSVEPEMSLPSTLPLQAEQICSAIASIPGIGQLTAIRLYSAYWIGTSFPKAGSLVHYAELNSVQHASAASVHGQASISRRGRSQIRHWLYMCAIVATRHDPDFRRWKEELKAGGKPGKVIIVAVMGKLLHLVHGVMKSGEAYDPRKA